MAEDLGFPKIRGTFLWAAIMKSIEVGVYFGVLLFHKTTIYEEGSHFMRLYLGAHVLPASSIGTNNQIAKKLWASELQ